MTIAHTRSYSKPSFDMVHDINPLDVLTMGLLAITVMWTFQIKKPEERIDAAMRIIPTFAAVGFLGKKALNGTTENEKNKRKLKESRIKETATEIAVKQRIAPKDFSPSVNAGTPELDERISLLNKHLKRYVDRFDVLQKLADYLERQETQPRLIELAKEAKDFVLQNTNKLCLLTTGLLSANVQDNFHRELYENLRVWLTVSIRYDVILPAPERFIKDRMLYVKALTFLRDHHVADFLTPDEFHENRLAFLSEYLTYLIEVIEKDK